MGLLMGMQVRFLVKSFVAARVGALKRLLTSVDPEVCFEIEVQWEPLAAFVAHVWLLSCMHKHVSLKLGVVQESLLTSIKGALKLKLTDKLLRQMQYNLPIYRHEQSYVSSMKLCHWTLLHNSQDGRRRCAPKSLALAWHETASIHLALYFF